MTSETVGAAVMSLFLACVSRLSQCKLTREDVEELSGILEHCTRLSDLEYVSVSVSQMYIQYLSI